MAPEHICDARLLPGECIVCVGKPKPTIRIESWAGSHVVPVEVIGVTAKRWRIRFLDDCQKGKRGTVRLVKPEVVRMGGQAQGLVVADPSPPLRPKEG